MARRAPRTRQRRRAGSPPARGTRSSPRASLHPRDHRAEVRVGRLERLRRARVEELPAGRLRDLTQRVRVGRHGDLGRAEALTGAEAAAPAAAESARRPGEHAVRRAERDRVDRDARRLGPVGALERLEQAAGLMAVGEEEDRDGALLRVRDRRVRDRLRPVRVLGLDQVDCRGERVADRGSPVAGVVAEAVEALADDVEVGRRRRGHLRVAGERDQRDPDVARHLLQEGTHRVLSCGQSRGLDVGRPHRARDVDHEDDGCAVGGDQGVAVRAGERDAERRERQQRECGRDVPAQRAAAGDGGQDVHVRERHRVLRRPALEPEIDERRDRQQQQGQEQKRVSEAHLPPAQIAPTWTIPWPRPARATTLTALRDTDVFVRRLETRAGEGGVGVPNPRARYQPTRRSSARQAVSTVDSPRTRSVTTRRVVGCPGGVTARTAVGVRVPPPVAGMQPMCGRNVGALRPSAHVGGDEHDRARRGHARARPASRTPR